MRRGGGEGCARVTSPARVRKPTLPRTPPSPPIPSFPTHVHTWAMGANGASLEAVEEEWVRGEGPFDFPVASPLKFANRVRELDELELFERVAFSSRTTQPSSAPPLRTLEGWTWVRVTCSAATCNTAPPSTLHHSARRERRCVRPDQQCGTAESVCAWVRWVERGVSCVAACTSYARQTTRNGVRGGCVGVPQPFQGARTLADAPRAAARGGEPVCAKFGAHSAWRPG